jgi:nicotinamidase/pyrazinamidase
MGRFDLVVASKDYHPQNSKHFESWPIHCVKGTKGAELHPELNSSKIDQVFKKGTSSSGDGYSAFDATNQNLEAYLKNKDVDALFISGLATDYCVKHSAISASQKGFRTYLVEDAVRGLNAKPGDVDRAVIEMIKSGVILINSEDLIA